MEPCASVYTGSIIHSSPCSPPYGVEREVVCEPHQTPGLAGIDDNTNRAHHRRRRPNGSAWLNDTTCAPGYTAPSTPFAPLTSSHRHLPQPAHSAIQYRLRNGDKMGLTFMENYTCETYRRAQTYNHTHTHTRTHTRANESAGRCRRAPGFVDNSILRTCTHTYTHARSARI